MGDSRNLFLFETNPGSPGTCPTDRDSATAHSRTQACHPAPLPQVTVFPADRRGLYADSGILGKIIRQTPGNAGRRLAPGPPPCSHPEDVRASAPTFNNLCQSVQSVDLSSRLLKTPQISQIAPIRKCSGRREPQTWRRGWIHPVWNTRGVPNTPTFCHPGVATGFSAPL